MANPRHKPRLAGRFLAEDFHCPEDKQQARGQGNTYPEYRDNPRCTTASMQFSGTGGRDVRTRQSGRNADEARREAGGPWTQRPSTPSTSAGREGCIYECDAATPANNTRRLQDRPRHQLHHSQDSVFVCKVVLENTLHQALSAFSD